MFVFYPIIFLSANFFLLSSMLVMNNHIKDSLLSPRLFWLHFWLIFFQITSFIFSSSHIRFIRLHHFFRWLLFFEPFNIDYYDPKTPFQMRLDFINKNHMSGKYFFSLNNWKTIRKIRNKSKRFKRVHFGIFKNIRYGCNQHDII